MLTVVNSNETLYYWLAVSVNKYGGNCSTTDNPYEQICFQNKVKKFNSRVFNLISSIND